jgi:uncharacterized protein YhfF
VIFSPELAKLIVQGKKTQTRRVAAGRDCRYKPGRSYAVQPGRGQKAVTRITVQAVRVEPLGALTLKDAKREGFRTTQEFRDHWQRLHGSYNPDLAVFVISFALGDLEDRPQLLAARPGHLSFVAGPDGRHKVDPNADEHQDYTTRRHLALPDEPEAVSVAQANAYASVASARDDRARRDRIREGVARIRAATADLRGDLDSAGGADRSVARALRVVERGADQLAKDTAA